MIAALLALVTAAAAGATPEAVAAEAAALCGRAGHLWYEVAGTTPGGRDLPLVIATARPEQVAGQMRVLVVAGQHGDEGCPTRAALLWLRAEAMRAARFERVAVLLMPLINPDGLAAGTRDNGLGVDLNRDWEAQTQPETQVVMEVFGRWKPHVVVDVHGFTGVVGGRRVQSDWMEWFEVGQPGSAAQDDASRQLVARVVAQQQALGEPLRGVATHLGRHPVSLAHRHFAARHQTPAFLLETGDDRADPEARALALLVAELDRRANALRPVLERGRDLSAWAPPRLAPKAAPAPRPVPMPASQAGGPQPAPFRPQWAIWCYLLVVAAGAKFSGYLDDDEYRRSPR